MITVRTLENVCDHFENINDHLILNSKRKNYFLAVCCELNPMLNANHLSNLAPHGGIIGIDDSKLDRIFKHSKIFRMHAVIHDAAGLVKSISNKGPGYSYILPLPISCCFFGHVFGLIFCTYIKTFKHSLYKRFDC